MTKTTTAVLLTAAITTAASANFTVEAAEVGGDVILTGAGSLDVSLWTLSSSSSWSVNLTGISDDYIAVGPTGGGLAYYTAPVGWAGPDAPLGLGHHGTTTGAGDTVMFVFATAYAGIHMQSGYASGDPLAGSSTLAGKSFGDMGASVGDTYIWSGDTASGERDTFTLTFVPAPGTAALLGFSGLIATRRRRTM